MVRVANGSGAAGAPSELIDIADGNGDWFEILDVGEVTDRQTISLVFLHDLNRAESSSQPGSEAEQCT